MNNRALMTKVHVGVTLIEFLVVLSIVGLLVSLSVVAVGRASESARRNQCLNRLRQIGLASHNYHGAFGSFPAHGTGTGPDPLLPSLYHHSDRTNQLGLSAFVALLPYLEQQSLWESIRHGGAVDAQGNQPPNIAALGGGPFSPMGPTPSSGHYDYPPWVTEIPNLRCPSDPGVGLPAVARTNYAVCIGDNAMKAHIGPVDAVHGHQADHPIDVSEVNRFCRGAFVTRHPISQSDVTDGLSRTILMAEIATDLGDNDIRTRGSFRNTRVNREFPGVNTCRHQDQISELYPLRWSSGLFPRKDPAGPASGWPPEIIPAVRRGYSWASFAMMHTAVTTILGPNSELCLSQRDELTPGNWSASSRHPGGVHALMADGSVQFITDNVHTGDTSLPVELIESGQESPYGVWGAMGTRAASDSW